MSWTAPEILIIIRPPLRCPLQRAADDGVDPRGAGGMQIPGQGFLPSPRIIFLVLLHVSNRVGVSFFSALGHISLLLVCLFSFSFDFEALLHNGPQTQEPLFFSFVQ